MYENNEKQGQKENVTPFHCLETEAFLIRFECYKIQRNFLPQKAVLLLGTGVGLFFFLKFYQIGTLDANLFSSN